jgi:hypothetical protein
LFEQENKAPSSKDANPPKEKPVGDGIIRVSEISCFDQKNTAPSSKDVNPPKEKPVGDVII